MKFKDAFVGGVIAAAICLGIAWACKDRNAVVIPDNTKYEQAIDSLNKEVRKLEITNDSLISVITNSKGKIDTLNNWYEKELIDITNQSIAADASFFAEYVSQAGR